MIPEVGLPQLSPALLGNLTEMPERVLQFGTGAFLRGFVEDFIDEANRTGRFSGRVVMVGSTGGGRATSVEEQGGLYTLQVRGLRGGEVVDGARVITAVSRGISASESWDDVLRFARSPDLSLVVSNTTEVGIVFDAEDQRTLSPPRSFPGKLTAVLLERAEAFDYSPSKGLVVLPCELIEANGSRLRATVGQLAERWGLPGRFLTWLDEAVTFCDTLVDRIVPGMPEDAGTAFEHLGYRDDLLTIAEPYRLWAIKGDASLASRLPFEGGGVVVVEDIQPYHERKVRVLNGGHSATVPVALLCGLETVADTVADEAVGPFIRRVILDEIVPSLDIDPEMSVSFARNVLDRFANPFVRHELLGITFQQTAKVGVRVIPSVVGYAEKEGGLPPLLAFSIAAFLATTKPGALPDHAPADDAASEWNARWEGVEPVDDRAVQALVSSVFSELWGGRLNSVPGFSLAVSDALVSIERDGARYALMQRLKT